jgi:putative endonuclease
MPAYVYIVECADGSFYTGWTTDVEKRVATHNAKKGAKYTKARVPVILRYVESFEDKQEAQSREYAVKQMTRAQKMKLLKKDKK